MEIQKLIAEILSDQYGQFYGYKKITALLRRSHNIKISKKKVYRLMFTMGVLKKQHRGLRKYKRICNNHEITRSNQLWELDTKYIYIAGTRQVAYLASIIDVFDRSIVSCVLSLSADAKSAQKALLQALYRRKLKDSAEGLTLNVVNLRKNRKFNKKHLTIEEKFAALL